MVIFSFDVIRLLWKTAGDDVSRCLMCGYSWALFMQEIPTQKKLATLEELYNSSENSFSIHELCEAL